MCGRTTATLSRDQAAGLLKVEAVDAPELPASWNVAPTQPVYVAITAANGQRKLEALRWGLIPRWAKDPRIGSKLINARAETVGRRPAYRDAIRQRRGLAAFDGFYEWRRPERGERVPAQPYYFRRADGSSLVFAVLWDTWWDAEGRALRSCAVVTCSANKAMAPVHHRMPVILEPQDWDEWLRPSSLSSARLEELLVPAREDLLTAHPVSIAVNSAVNNGPELIEPVLSEASAIAQHACGRSQLSSTLF